MNTAQIEYVVLAGGGVKGVTYGGLIQALEHTGLISGLKAFSGTSAGANTAALLSVGMSSEDLQTKVLNQDLSQRLGEGYFAWFGHHGWFNDGKPVIDFINELLIETIQKNIADIDLADNNENKKAFEKFKISLNNKADKPKITFGHLALLRKIKPEKFKNLYITAVSKKNSELKIFSSEGNRDKDISIAEACRASSSLPILFSPADINGEKFLDGGLKNNIPFEPFLVDDTKSVPEDNQQRIQLTSKKEEEILSRTLVCTLNEGGRSIENNPIYKALFGEKTEEYWITTSMEKVILLIMRALGLIHDSYVKDINNDYSKITQNNIEFNVLNLDTEGLTLTDFKIAQNMGDEKYLKGYFSTMQYLIDYEKLNHLSESDYKTLVDKTRLQEYFFKIITGADLNRDTELYKNLMKFCKDEKFKGLTIPSMPENRTDSRKEFNEAYDNYIKLQESNDKYKKWRDSARKLAEEEPKNNDWEKAKAKYNTDNPQIKAYDEAFNDIQYLKNIVESFFETINSSSGHSSDGAKAKLQKSLDAMKDDPYISSGNIKKLFDGFSLTNSINLKQSTSLS